MAGEGEGEGTTVRERRRSDVGELLVPRRLGTPFRWLLGSSWTSNLGDGIALAAGPLLVASQTDSAFLVALAATMVWAPPLVVGLVAGALTDRLDRRRLVVSVNLVRTVVLAVLVTFILTGAVSIAVVLVTLFLLGVAETFADNAASTLTPMLVARDDLPVANQRIQTGFLTLNQMAGPPLGAALFAAGSAWPFGAQAVAMALAALLITRVGVADHRTGTETIASIRHDVAEGFRWVAHHAAVRTLVLTIFVFNLTWGAAWGVLVLYATERLGLGPAGFGLISTVSAVGGVVGTLSYGWITRRLSLSAIMKIGLIIETLTHLALALTTTPWVAMIVFAVFGAHAFVWGTTSVSVRQRATPTRLQGRVGSVYLVGVFGGLVVGSTLGGVLAQTLGITAPFWWAFGGSAVFLVLIWRQLRHIAHADVDVSAGRTAVDDG